MAIEWLPREDDKLALLNSSGQQIGIWSVSEVIEPPRQDCSSLVIRIEAVRNGPN